MTDLVARVDLRDLEAGLAGLLRSSRDLTPIFKEARRPLRRDQMEHAKERKGPDGTWPARSPITEERTRRRRRVAGKKRARKRRMLGKLPGAIRIVVTSSSVRAESLAKWSGVHQAGGTAGKGAKIPRRTFLWPSSKLITIVAALAASHLAKGWR